MGDFQYCIHFLNHIKTPHLIIPMSCFDQLFKPSMSSKNKKGESVSPCLNPLLVGKKPSGELFISIDNLTVLMQNLIHLIHFLPKKKPILCRLASTYLN